jgi:ATP-dependent RNA helicase SUPV3L1/SUV3
MEVFYTFTWAPRPRHDANRGPRREGGAREGGRGPRREGAEGEAKAERPNRGPREGGKPREDRPRTDGKPGGKPEGRRDDQRKGGKFDRRDDRKDGHKPKNFEARPPKAEKPIDPDNPFAALLALKGKV